MMMGPFSLVVVRLCHGRGPKLHRSRQKTADADSVTAGTEEDVVKSKKTFRSQAVVNQNAETELMLEGDDDAVSLLQEKEIDNLAAPKFLPRLFISRGPVVLSTPAQLIAPVVVAKGTLSITTTEIYFEVDEDDPAFKKIDPKVSTGLEGGERGGVEEEEISCNN
ncbi:neurobeachin-like [Rhineura floridana]|uniref:neurobeachin-like n=1 Tax=Rhineura floridana TaxID=261503 RepID=UPI002AC826CC|nr:neurobeachin-like [Rhineura floridana]